MKWFFTGEMEKNLLCYWRRKQEAFSNIWRGVDSREPIVELSRLREAKITLHGPIDTVTTQLNINFGHYMQFEFRRYPSHRFVNTTLQGSSYIKIIFFYPPPRVSETSLKTYRVVRTPRLKWNSSWTSLESSSPVIPSASSSDRLGKSFSLSSARPRA